MKPDSIFVKFKLQEAQGSPKEAMHACHRLVKYFWYVDQDSTWKYINKFRARAKDLNSTRHVVQSYRQEANFCRKKKDLEGALGALQTAWKLLQENGDDSQRVSILGDFVGIYYDAGFYQAARKYLKNQLEITQNDPQASMSCFGTLNNLGFCTMELADQIPEMLDSAGYYFQEALELALLTDSEVEQILVYDYLGEFELRRGNAEAATSYFEQEFDMWEEYGRSMPKGETRFVFQGRAAYGLAKSYEMRGNSSKVMEYIEEARRIWAFLKVDTQEEKLAKLKMLEAKVHIARNQFSLAHQAIGEGIDIFEGAKKVRINDDPSELYKEAGILKAELGAFEESNFFLQKYLEFERKKKLEADQWAFFSNHSDLTNQVLELSLQQERQAGEQARRVRNLALGTTTVVLVLGLLILFLYRNLRKSHRLNQKYSGELLELNETRDKLISILGHDLRGPFQSIMLMSREAQNGLELMELEQIEGTFRVIGESSREMYFLFENLLEWARCQSGTLPYQPENIDLRELLQETKVVTQSMAEANGISIKVRMESFLVVGDPFMIRTILRNLLGNAIKYSPRGSQIEIHSRISEEGKTTISVIDQGHGIDEELAAALSQGIHFTEGKHGLGLVLCRDFLGLHGSSLSIESETNKGSRFSFELETAESIEGVLTGFDLSEEWTSKLKTIPNLGLPEIRPQKLQEMSEQFKGLKVYQTSRAHHLLATLEEEGLPNLGEWRTRFRNALNEFDEEEFQQLMAMFFPLTSETVDNPVGK